MQGTLIHCEAFYDTDTHRILIHVPEELKPTNNGGENETPQPRRRGRPTLYSSDEERKAKHREQALQYYYRKKALNSANTAAARIAPSTEPLAIRPMGITTTAKITSVQAVRSLAKLKILP